MVRALVISSAASGFAMLAGGPLIAALRRYRVGKAISEEGPESHHAKAGTPTMGGLLILGTILVFTLATNLVGKLSVLLPLGAMGAAAALGVADDVLTLQGRERIGGHERGGLVMKFLFGAAVGVAVGLIAYYPLEERRALVPHYGEYELAAAAYVAIAVLVVATTTSAAAITDGLDGLLAGLMALAFFAYGMIAFWEGLSYLGVFCLTVTGALIGFLWHNGHPASVFMGETAAIPLGVGLATAALMTGWWLVLPVVGFVFVVEGLSDLAQIASFRLTGRRVLRMAPIHHHFELLGWAEPQVVFRFWLVGAVGALLGLALVLTE